MSAEKPVSGFAKKKALEAIGCRFEKEKDAGPRQAPHDEWVCYLDGQKIACSRLQGDCVEKVIEAIGGL